MWCLRSGRSPGQSFLGRFAVEMFGRAASTSLIISVWCRRQFGAKPCIDYEKAGWLKRQNRRVKKRKNKQEKRARKKQQFFLRSQRPPSARSLVIISEFAQKHSWTCVGVVFTSLKAESRAHENSHTAETSPYHRKNNQRKYNSMLEFFQKLTKSQSCEAADWFVGELWLGLLTFRSTQYQEKNHWRTMAPKVINAIYFIQTVILTQAINTQRMRYSGVTVHLGAVRIILKGCFTQKWIIGHHLLTLCCFKSV